MLDAAGILMNNYQIVSSRVQATQPQAPAASTTTFATTSAAAEAFLEPSTSAAAASKSSPAKEPTIAATVEPTIAPTAAAVLNKHNEVTIEDLGGEEPDYSSNNTPANDAGSSQSNSTLITHITTTSDVETNELSELRKRRLKFLEEKNKPSSSGD